MLWLLAEGSGQASPGLLDMALPFILIFALMYFLFLRPQKKQEATRKAMIASVQKNDRIMTNGGIIGVVTNVKDDELTVRVDEARDVKLRIKRTFIAAVLDKKEEE